MSKTMMNVNDVASEMEVSKSKAYIIIRQLNDELKKHGYIIVPGKIPRKYFATKLYGGLDETKEERV